MRVRVLVIAAVLASASVAAGQMAGAWTYPRDPGRNPMQAPAELYRSGGRAALKVEVVITSPVGSRALVRLGEGGTYTAVAPGDRIGDYRITRIGPDGVVAVLSALGADRSLAFPVDTQTARRP
jgi:hypothetical protein